MESLVKVVADALSAVKHGSLHNHIALNKQVRDAFSSRLAGKDVFCIEGECRGNFLRTVIDHEDCGVSVLFYANGVLTQAHEQGSRIYYTLTGGEGRAFKFIRHSDPQSVPKEAFCSWGFPYSREMLALSVIKSGAIARVTKPIAQSRFSIDALGRVTEVAIQDIRVYENPAVLVDRARVIFEELMTGTDAEWEWIFRLMFT